MAKAYKVLDILVSEKRPIICAVIKYVQFVGKYFYGYLTGRNIFRTGLRSL